MPNGRRIAAGRAAWPLLALACSAPPSPTARVREVGTTTAPAAPSAVADSAAARRAVTGFYAWYVPVAQQSGGTPPGVVAVRERGDMIARPLAAALLADAAAQDSADGEIVGIDWDPFVGGQDPCERYEVGASHPSGSGFTFDVVGVCGGARHQTPDAVVDVLPDGGAWRIADVRYPGAPGGPLTTTLAGLAADRRAHR